MPFWFMFYWNGERHSLHGEGTGGKEASDLAFDDLKALSKQDIIALIDSTKRPTSAE